MNDFLEWEDVEASKTENYVKYCLSYIINRNVQEDYHFRLDLNLEAKEIGKITREFYFGKSKRLGRVPDFEYVYRQVLIYLKEIVEIQLRWSGEFYIRYNVYQEKILTRKEKIKRYIYRDKKTGRFTKKRGRKVKREKIEYIFYRNIKTGEMVSFKEAKRKEKYIKIISEYYTDKNGWYKLNDKKDIPEVEPSE